jgi:hypothetical protein
MTYSEVIKRIGSNRWDEFVEFMYGQTIGLYEDGSTDYFECDVENFLRKPKDRFFD